MGNKRSRDLSRPKDRGKPCICDVFDLTIACENDVLVVSLRTDLPATTRVNLAAKRLLRESNGHQWDWTCLETNVPVTPQQGDLNGFVLRFTNTELDTKGLHMYRHLKRAMNAIIAAVPSMSIEVSVSAPTTLHRYGICNRRLTGKAVTVEPSAHTLERVASVEVPPSSEVMSRLRF